MRNDKETMSEERTMTEKPWTWGVYVKRTGALLEAGRAHGRRREAEAAARAARDKWSPGHLYFKLERVRAEIPRRSTGSRSPRARDGAWMTEAARLLQRAVRARGFRFARDEKTAAALLKRG
jgi:hypothetical protein